MQASFIVLLVGLMLAATPGVEERARTRVYRMRLRFEPAWGVEPGACRGRGLDDLRVELRGVRITDPEGLRLEREREATLHALVIDTSQSMVGRLEQARAVASDYVRALELGRDRAMVVTFDETVVLIARPTADRGRLLTAIAGIRLSHETSLHDALVTTLAELEIQRERPVMVLLTDGIDSTSFHDRADVLDRLELRPELTIFSIGLGLPPLGASGPAGQNSAAKFLQQLAARTGGEFFDAPTPSRLEPSFRRVRELVDDERILSVVDPDPEAPPGRVRVGTIGGGCTVRVVHEERPEPRRPRPRPTPALAEMQRTLAVQRVDPGCEPSRPIAVSDHALAGCVLDVTLEQGALYDPYETLVDGINDWVRLRTRPLEASLPAPSELVIRPELLLDHLARAALDVAGDEIEIDGRRRPREEHARPYHDQPGLMSSHAWFELRGELARLLSTREDYRHWLVERFRAETAERLRQMVPAIGARELEAVLEPSMPESADRERHLAAWLGDISAAELFSRWEGEWIRRLLGGDPAAASFPAAWAALRRVFWVPSYTRSLVIVEPARDEATGAIGYWRVILPRAGWIEERVRGDERPLDLVPDLPLGFLVVSQHVAELRSADFVTARVSYELLSPAWKHDPRRAFARTRVTVELDSVPRLVAEIELVSDEPRIEALEIRSFPPPAS